MLSPRPFRALAFALLVGAGLTASAPAMADTTHVVGRGQTLFWIAKRYRTTPEAIRSANGLREGQLIHPGLSLTIPGVSRGKEADAKAAKTAKDDPKGAKSAKDDPKDRAKGGAAKGKEREKEAEKEASHAKGKGKAKDPKDARDAKDSKDPKGAKSAKDPKKADPTANGTYALRPKKPGFVTMHRGTEKLDAQLLTRGQLNRAALPGLTKILRHVASDSKKPIDPRLAYLIGVVSDHFGGRPIQVVSGYRPFSKKQYTPHSNHNLGRAMDFAIEGVPNTVLRDYCRTLRDAGVGYYPNSTFVHLDVRTGKAYWIDYSRPGEPPKYDAKQKGKADESAGDVEGADENGSSGTQGTSKQPAESKAGSPTSAGATSTGSATPGARAPTPSGGNSTTPDKGVSSDPYP